MCYFYNKHTITIFYSLAGLVRIILFSPLKNKIHIFTQLCNILYIYCSTSFQFYNEVSRALKRVTCREHVTAMQICCMVCKLSHHSLYLDIILSKLSFLMWSPSGSRKGDLQLKLAAYTTVFLALHRVQMQFCQCCLSSTDPLAGVSTKRVFCL